MPAYSRDHMTPVLAKLHRLHIRTRLSFKIATTVFKIRQTKQPGETDRGRRSMRTLWLPTCGQGMPSKKTMLVTSAGAFRYAAEKTWNYLPDKVRSADTLEIFDLV